MEDKIISEMKNIFGDDQKRINHAFSVLRYAKMINEKEKGEDLIVIASAILHDIGIHKAEKKYNSNAGVYQEIEGPPIAKNILESLNFEEKDINHICKIIANHHSAKDIDTKEFRIIWDSDWIVNIIEDEMLKSKDEKEKSNFINKIFKTDNGNKIAKELFLEN